MLAGLTIAFLFQPNRPIGWEEVLAHLTAKPEAFRLLRPGKELGKRAETWVKRCGLPVAAEPFGQGPDGGLWVPGAVPITGSPGSALVLLEKPEGSCLVLFRRQGKRLHASILESSTETHDRLALPEDAALAGPNLFVAARRDWLGNGDNIAIKSFRRGQAGWVRVGDEAAIEQCREIPPLRLAVDGKSVRSMMIRGYTYPGSMSASHAAARYCFEQKWIFSSGVAKPQWERPANTAFNALNDLLGAVAREDIPSVRRYCLNEQIFKALWKLRPRLIRENLDPILLGVDEDLEPNPVGFDSIGKSFRLKKVEGRWLLARITPWHHTPEP